MPFPSNVPGYKVNEVSTNVDLHAKPLERLKQIGDRFIERYMIQCWIENDTDSFTGWRWEKYNVQLTIVSAANRYGNIIVTGPRHYSNIMNVAIDAMGGTKLLRKYAGDDNYEQGFIDQYGTFHNRREAWILAVAANQIRYPDNAPEGELYSEHLC